MPSINVHSSSFFDTTPHATRRGSNTTSTYANTVRPTASFYHQSSTPEPAFHFDEMLRTTSPLATPITYLELVDSFRKSKVLHLIVGMNLHHQKQSIELHVPDRTTREGIKLKGLTIRNHNVQFVPLIRDDVIKVFNVPLQYDGPIVDNIITRHGATILSKKNISITTDGLTIRTGEFHYTVKKGDFWNHIPTVVKLFGGRWIGFRYPGQPSTDPPPNQQSLPNRQGPPNMMVYPPAEHGTSPHLTDSPEWNTVTRDGKHNVKRKMTPIPTPDTTSSSATTSHLRHHFNHSPTPAQMNFHNRFSALNVEADTANVHAGLNTRVFNILSTRNILQPTESLVTFNQAFHGSSNADVPVSPADSLPTYVPPSQSPPPSNLEGLIAQISSVVHTHGPTESEMAAYVSNTNTESVHLTTESTVPSPDQSAPLSDGEDMLVQFVENALLPLQEVGVHPTVPEVSLLAQLARPPEHGEAQPSPISITSSDEDGGLSDAIAQQSAVEHASIDDSTLLVTQELLPSSEDGLTPPLHSDFLLHQAKEPPDPGDGIDSPYPKTDAADGFAAASDVLSQSLVTNTLYKFKPAKRRAGADYTGDEEQPPVKVLLSPSAGESLLITCGQYIEDVKLTEIHNVSHLLESTYEEVTLRYILLYLLTTKTDFDAIPGWQEFQNFQRHALPAAALRHYCGNYADCELGILPPMIAADAALRHAWSEEIWTNGLQPQRMDYTSTLLRTLNDKRAEH